MIMSFSYLYLYALFFSSSLLFSVELPHLVVSVCTYNNEEWAWGNLESIHMQTYPHFRCIITDDASQDNTTKIIEKFIKEHNLEDRFTLIKNKVRQRKLYNMYTQFHSCCDREIIAQLDGDDRFASPETLYNIALAYIENDCWLTYGTHVNDPSDYNRGNFASSIKQTIIDQRMFRKVFPYMPTRTFYAWLFKLIKLEDLINATVPGHEGEFYPAANDGAIMWPMAEMAHTNFHYIKKTTYIANRHNPNIGIKVDRSLQIAGGKELRSKMPVYPIVKNPVIDRLKKFDHSLSDIIIVSHTPEQTAQLITQIKNKIRNIDALFVVCDTDDSSTYLNNETLNNNKNITLINVRNNDNNITMLLESSPSQHVFLLNDNVPIKNTLDCRNMIQQLEKTFAWGFYSNLNINTIIQYKVPAQHIWQDIYAWKFILDKNKKIAINNFNASLYRKESFITALKNKMIGSLIDFVSAWKQAEPVRTKVGLFYSPFNG